MDHADCPANEDARHAGMLMPVDAANLIPECRGFDVFLMSGPGVDDMRLADQSGLADSSCT
jgi:hypothetical protein